MRVFMIVVGLAASSCLSAGPGAWTLYSTYYNQTYPVSIPSDSVGSPVTISGGFSPTDIAITPDASRALVVGNLNTSASVVNVLDLTQSPIAVTTVGGFVSPQCVAITPDGKLAVVTDAASSSGSVCLLDLTGPTVTIQGWGPSSGGGIFGVAITPDGTKALVANSDTVSSGSLGIYTIGSTIELEQTLPDLSGLWKIAITPDGTKALATTTSGYDGVRVFDLTASPVQPAYTVADTGMATGVAITPDGTVGIAVNYPDSSISVLDLTLPTVAKKQANVETEPLLQYIAISPDGAKAYVSASFEGVVFVYDLTQNPIVFLKSFYVPCLSFAITPDQSPTASFALSARGLTVSCDGSLSSSPIGTIAQYQWDFGDGIKVSTSSPLVSHTYKDSGLYTVSLTVVNSGGTSTKQVFTGQTMSNRGLPQAQSSKRILATPAAPASFTGKASLDKKKGQVLLKVHWLPSTDDNVVGYELLERGRRVASVSPATSSMTLKLHPHHVPKKISRKYRVYLHDKYSIRSVVAIGLPSPGASLNVKS